MTTFRPFNSRDMVVLNSLTFAAVCKSCPEEGTFRWAVIALTPSGLPEGPPIAFSVAQAGDMTWGDVDDLLMDYAA